METKEFKIEVPAGYEIDKKNSTFEKIVFKKVEEKIRWVDCVKKEKGYYINNIANINYETLEGYDSDKRCFKNKSTAEAVLALAQLEWLRDEYIRRYYPENPNWKPDWTNNAPKFSIAIYENKIDMTTFHRYSCFLAFPTAEIRDKFVEEQRELIEQVKPLL